MNTREGRRTRSWFAQVLATGTLCLLTSVLVGCGADEPLPKTAYGPEGMAVQEGDLLAPAPDPDGKPISGVPCSRPAEPEYHVHSHLAVYVDGELRPVPAGIGMVDPRTEQTRTGPKLFGPRCYYGLHLHAQDGVIHAEGPEPGRFTLGQFFDVWGQPLSSTRVGPARGRVTVYVDGRLTVGPPRDIVLYERQVVQINVGAAVPPAPVDWSHY